MPFNPNAASMMVEMKSRVHAMADVSFVLNAIDGIVCAGVWAALAHPGDHGGDLLVAREYIEHEIRVPKSQARFFPSWQPFRDPETVDAPRFDPLDPMDAGVRDGMMSFLQRALRQHDAELYSRLFGFASVRHLEQHSPLVVELDVLLSGAVAIAPLLTWGVMRAVVSARRAAAETRIREAEADIREEEARQKRIQTQILEEVAAAARELGPHGIPPAAIEKVAQISTTAVNDLGSSSLIGSITVGLSTKTA